MFNFLDVQQFTSGFISQEILKILLNQNIYAVIKRQPNPTQNAIYLYKKGFRYELFTLVMQGNATLESGIERILSTVGPFSCFAPSALLGELFRSMKTGEKNKFHLNSNNSKLTTKR